MRTLVLPIVLLLTACAQSAGDAATNPGDKTNPAASDADADGFGPDEGDCDDQNPAINPDATEQCNGADDDCDGTTDAGLLQKLYADVDGDGAGSNTGSFEGCAGEPDTSTRAGDCDDQDPTVTPDAEEVCDGVDNNCSGEVDEGVTVTVYPDADQDGYGDPLLGADGCGIGANTSLTAGDCDDLEATVFPGNPEACDGLDNNCDGAVDEGVLSTFYADTDSDDYGDPGAALQACFAPVGHIPDGSDCDDTRASTNPDGAEVCNGRDDDCDGVTDDDASDRSVWYADRDGDGYGDAAARLSACEVPVGYVADSTDCQDGDRQVSPGADEQCNGIDDDCDGAVDTAAVDAPTWYEDLDGDGFGDGIVGVQCEAISGASTLDGDCDDGQAAVSPSADERCNGQDDDCDGTTDEADAIDATSWYDDRDNDGYGDPSSAETACEANAGQVADNTDCDDLEARVNPGELEACDGADNNCDGTIDEATAYDADTWYADLDADGYGDVRTSVVACAAPAGYVGNATDCDDDWAAAYPGATEVCDDHDNNCDGEVDEFTAVDAPTWYLDLDGDGFGRSTGGLTQCDGPAGYLTDNTDCDDAEAERYPGNPEVCDTLDNDCNTLVDDRASDATVWYADTDGDGHGDAGSFLAACEAPAGYVVGGTDCNDRSVTVYPGAPERCDTVDQDCDGILADDESSDATAWYLDTDGDGYGVGSATTSCTALVGYVALNEDCDDSLSTTYPNSHEIEVPYDGDDTDCDGNDFCTDLNCDGWPDLVFANEHDNGSYDVSSYVYMGSASGFTSAPESYVTFGAVKAAVDDLNGDGYQDLVFVNGRSDTTVEVNSTVLWGSATGYSEFDRSDLAVNSARDVCIADFDADGKKDLAFAAHENDVSRSTNSMVYLHGSATPYSRGIWLPTSGATACATGDFDGDGNIDVSFLSDGATSTTSTGTGYIFWGTTAGPVVPTSYYDLSGQGYDAWGGDLDGDGTDDLLWVGAWDGDHAVASEIRYGGPRADIDEDDTLDATGAISVAVTDLDQNGYADVVFASYQDDSTTPYSTSATVYYGAAGGPGAAYDTLPNLGARSVATGDLNGDGYAEIVFANSRLSGGLVEIDSYVYWQVPTSTTPGEGSFSAAYRTALPTSCAAGVALGDLDLDGDLDVVFANQRDERGDFEIDSYIYWNVDGFLSDTNMSLLPTEGASGDPVIVGRR